MADDGTKVKITTKSSHLRERDYNYVDSVIHFLKWGRRNSSISLWSHENPAMANLSSWMDQTTIIAILWPGIKHRNVLYIDVKS